MPNLFRILPFGSNWCLMFVADEKPKGIVAIRENKEDFKKITETIDMLVKVGANIRVAIRHDHQVNDFPGVNFLLSTETEKQVSDWLVMKGPEPYVAPMGPDNGPKVVTHEVLNQHFPSTIPYPKSLNEIEIASEQVSTKGSFEEPMRKTAKEPPQPEGKKWWQFWK